MSNLQNNSLKSLEDSRIVHMPSDGPKNPAESSCWEARELNKDLSHCLKSGEIGVRIITLGFLLKTQKGHY